MKTQPAIEKLAALVASGILKPDICKYEGRQRSRQRILCYAPKSC